jgi:hypothetical protein
VIKVNLFELDPLSCTVDRILILRPLQIEFSLQAINPLPILGESIKMNYKVSLGLLARESSSNDTKTYRSNNPRLVRYPCMDIHRSIAFLRRTRWCVISIGLLNMLHCVAKWENTSTVEV